MRILGLDFGSKTVGVAVSDELLITAQGVEIIRRKSQSKLRQTLARIDELVGEYKVEKIVLGYPKNMNNTEGDRCEKTKEFKEMLEKRCGLPVILWDERLTTVAADQSMMAFAAKTARNMWTKLRQYLFCRDIWIICPIIRKKKLDLSRKTVC